MKLHPNHSLIKKASFAIIGFILLFAACKPKDPDCYQSTLVLNFSQFKERHLDTVTITIDSSSTFVDTIQKVADSIMPAPEMLVLDEDSAYSVSGKEVVKLPCPFNPAKDSIRYRFRADTSDTQYDTLTFFYTSTPHFINNNCGYTYYYNLDRVKSTNHVLDSSYIISPSLTDDNTNKAQNANVIFYFKRKS
jgi:hypothetical protein